ncbi:MAG: dockerin type I domain-containing protein, partial [Ruminococcus sp.]|nr:dockerin type I domain-containing protein [Ruminococcus sp.]
MKKVLSSFVSSILALNVVTSTGAVCFDSGIRTSAAAVSNEGYDNALNSKKVKSENDAAEIVREIISEHDINKETDSFVYLNTENSLYNDIYTFQQIYNGIPVENGYISLIADNMNYNVDHVNNSFITGITVDVNPSVSDSEAISAIKNQYEVEVKSTPELLIHKSEDGNVKLVWHVQTTDTEIVGAYVDAHSGEIVKTIHSNNYAVTYTCTKDEPITGLDKFNVTLDYQEGDNYDTVRYYDPVRNIWMLGRTSIDNTMMEICEEKNDDQFLLNNPKYFEENYMNTINENLSKFYLNTEAEKKNWKNGNSVNAITAANLYQVGKVYDFYYDNFNYKGTDGKNGAILISYNESRVGASANPYGNLLTFGSGIYSNDGVNIVHTYETAALDLIAHEYTHRVSINKVRWGRSSQTGETGSLCEAYSDIMGEYADPLNDWKIGIAMYKVLDNPESYVPREPTLTPIKCDAAKYEELGNSNDSLFYKTPIVYNNEVFKDIECHHGSVTITHVAYLMHKFGIPDNIARKIWYTSMDYLPDGNDVAKFADCREAVLTAASKVLDRDKAHTYLQKLEWIYKIKTAFNAVNLVDKYDLIGDVNLDRTVDQNDVTALTNYINGTYSPSHPVAGYYADVNFDGVVNSKDVTALKAKINNVSILLQPINDYTKSGSNISASVAACGTNLSYQWYYKDPGSSSFTKASCTTPTYTFKMTTLTSGRQVYCIVKDSNGKSVKSDTVTLTTQAAITKHPESTYTKIGSTAKTTVTATGNGLKYQWYYKNPGSSSFSKSSVTTSTYSCTMSSAISGREVYCVVTDTYGRSAKSNTATLRSQVTITKQPTNASATIGTNILTSVKAEGHGLQYQWYYCNDGETTFKKSSITSATYYCEMTEERAGRKVYCEITDMFGNKVKTRTVTLTSDI